MTTLTLLYKERQPIGFHCEGHSGYAEAGEDIVCAAISSITQFCINVAEQFELPIKYSVNEALLQCNVEHPDAIFTGLIDALKKSATELSEDYPEYIRLQIMEV